MVSALLVAGAAGAQAPPGLGTEEFGLNQRELVQAIERVEELISKCMRERGFQYVAADHNTVRAGMAADKKLPGMSEEEFIGKYGFGLATLYTGQPPQLIPGYSPAKVGLGEQNVQYFKSLSAGDQAAYNFALLGENNGATFAVALETENLSATGGCTLKGPCCMDQPVDAVIPGPRGLIRCGRSSGVPAQHAVEDVDSECHFCCLTLVWLRTQRMTDAPFSAADIGFHQGTPVVPRRFLPTHAAMFGNHLQMPVTRSRRRLGGLARHRI